MAIKCRNIDTIRNLPFSLCLGSTRGATHYLITLERSPIGLPPASRATLEALGLHDKLHRSVMHPFSSTTAGQILKVKELVRVKNVTEEEGLQYIKRRKGEGKGWEVTGRAYGPRH